MHNQYLEQLPASLRHAVIGNAGTTIAYRIGATDAPLISAHLGMDQMFHEAELKGPQQLTGLPNFQAFVRTLADGEPVTHALTPLLAPAPLHARVHRLLANSRAQFGRDRERVEALVAEFYAHQ